MWLLVSGFLDGIPANCFRVQHINSHLAVVLRDDPLDDWLAFWNDVADRNATLAHAQRSEEFVHVCQQFRQHHLASEQDVDKLRDLHLAIGHLRGTLVSGISQDDDEEPDQRLLCVRCTSVKTGSMACHWGGWNVGVVSQTL